MNFLHSSTLQDPCAGTGQSTLGSCLSPKLNIRHISLDAIFWQPGWQRMSDDEFKAAVGASSRGWTMDGDYSGLGTMVT
ncbi:hypothetical protein PAXRUDRAFT_800220 [Paxillus rubicundulus Ve08.2h10]|uniref:Uncharacterized protein n=1 Tax=Paxillus rubicundulus Ve08.2h10 TaxID=930991 RepID=A0A0D0DX46_9AGAM|nr:hypothetical protein PAXRUDRAFT_800220 [Paxillus rubicundulus Ve08.2h10]